jgi:hypothetical protein
MKKMQMKGYKKGGKVTGGAAGGLGRLEKTAAAPKAGSKKIK